MDALPFEGSWLHSAVVDPGNDLCYLTAVGVDKTTKGPLQWGFMVDYSIPLPKQHPLVYKGAWELSG
jgi:hypothetical protein